MRDNAYMVHSKLYAHKYMIWKLLSTHLPKHLKEKMLLNGNCFHIYILYIYIFFAFAYFMAILILISGRETKMRADLSFTTQEPTHI